MMTDPLPPYFAASNSGPPHPDDLHPDDAVENISRDDHTPYAVAREEGTRGFLTMCRWVWRSGKNRLAHLCLTRPSIHSRRFARINILLFAIAVMFCIFANASLHAVRRGPGIEGESATPTGKGWWQAVECADASGRIRPSNITVSSVWINAPWAAVAGCIGLVSVLILGMVLMALVGSRAQRSVHLDDRVEPRLRAGIHYSTAWLVFLTLAALILCVRPLAVMKEVAGWPIIPKPLFVDATALLVGLMGLMLWWFWLIRLGGTVPERSRQSVTRFFVLWGPLTVAVLVGVAAYGLYLVAENLPHRLGLSW
ncbi:MAG: hypothetical protein GXP29_13750 [Planctomycetes bacterium]|nr:hypothetical protein [Planctomycetota bacterium]